MRGKMTEEQANNQVVSLRLHY